MRIVTLDEIKEELQRHIRRCALFPIIGSGFTTGCQIKDTGYLVPSGVQMKDYMTKYLSDRGYSVPSESSFSRIARYYERVVDREDYWRYFRNHFINVELPNPQRLFLSVKWKYVYTLNLDDAIERNSRYNEIILPKTCKKIAGYAFNKCDNIKKMTIPEKVTKIGCYAIGKTCGELIFEGKVPSGMVNQKMKKTVIRVKTDYYIDALELLIKPVSLGRCEVREVE